MRLVEACLFAYFLFSFVISTPIPPIAAPPPKQSTSTAVQVRIFIFGPPLDLEHVPPELRSNVHQDFRSSPTETTQGQFNEYTNEVVLAMRSALEAGAHVHAVTFAKFKHISTFAFPIALDVVQPLCNQSACILTFPTVIHVGESSGRIDELINIHQHFVESFVRKMNDAVVTVTPVLKDHGRYKETLRSGNRQGDIWVSPQLASGGTDDETPVAKETKPKAITSDIATSSVLQVAGLVAQLVIQYPKESPAEIKSRILGKGLKQSWPGTVDHYILEFPIKDIGLFGLISPTPLNNEGHGSSFGTSAPSNPKSLPPVRPSTIRPLPRPLRQALSSNTNQESPPDAEILPGNANLRGLKRPHDHDDNTHGDGR